MSATSSSAGSVRLASVLSTDDVSNSGTTPTTTMYPPSTGYSSKFDPSLVDNIRQALFADTGLEYKTGVTAAESDFTDPSTLAIRTGRDLEVVVKAMRYIGINQRAKVDEDKRETYSDSGVSALYTGAITSDSMAVRTLLRRPNVHIRDGAEYDSEEVTDSDFEDIDSILRSILKDLKTRAEVNDLGTLNLQDADVRREALRLVCRSTAQLPKDSQSTRNWGTIAAVATATALMATASYLGHTWYTTRTPAS